MSHTPEPWEVYEGPEDKPELTICYEDRTKQLVMVADCLSGDVPPKERRHNATRIVECVNGCAGLNPAAYRDCVQALRRARTWLDCSEDKGDKATIEIIDAALTLAEQTSLT